MLFKTVSSEEKRWQKETLTKIWILCLGTSRSLAGLSWKVASSYYNSHGGQVTLSENNYMWSDLRRGKMRGRWSVLSMVEKKTPNRKNASIQVWIGNHGIISKIRLQRLKDSENLKWYRRLLRIPATKTEWLVRKDLEIRASLLSDQLSWLVWDSQNSAPRATSQTWENRDGRLPYGYIILSQDQTFFWVRGGLF